VPVLRQRDAAAGVFRPARYDHLVLRRDDVEPLRAIFADHMRTSAPIYAPPMYFTHALIGLAEVLQPICLNFQLVFLVDTVYR
jgi:hypothetical protein